MKKDKEAKKKKKEKGNGQPVWSCPFPFFMQPPYSIGLR